MPMLVITFVYAGVMVIFGWLMYGIADNKSLTAFIPGFIGIVVAVLGAVAIKKDIRMHMMHAIVGLALLVALVGLVMGLMQLANDQINTLKVVDMIGMGVISVAYLVFAVRSFIAARRARNPQAGQEA